LKTPVPGHAGGPTQLQIDLLGGVRFIRAFTRNPEGGAVDTDLGQDVQRRWEFKTRTGPFDPAIEICVQSAYADDEREDLDGAPGSFLSWRCSYECSANLSAIRRPEPDI
jgi:hypothetical protein